MQLPIRLATCFCTSCGNLQHFIGAVLGNTGYVRKREDEFNLKALKRSVLEQELKTTQNMLNEVLPELSDEQLATTYPINVFGHEMTTGFFLLHLNGHFNYHLGQINYHEKTTGQGMINIQKHIPLKEHNTFGLSATAVFQVSNDRRAKSGLAKGEDNLLLLGGGSNILLTQDFEGLVLKNELFGIEKIGRQ